MILQDFDFAPDLDFNLFSIPYTLSKRASVTEANGLFTIKKRKMELKFIKKLNRDPPT